MAALLLLPALPLLREAWLRSIRVVCISRLGLDRGRRKGDMINWRRNIVKLAKWTVIWLLSKGGEMCYPVWVGFFGDAEIRETEKGWLEIFLTIESCVFIFFLLEFFFFFFLFFWILQFNDY